jgi:hypothetical protein
MPWPRWVIPYFRSKRRYDPTVRNDSERFLTKWSRVIARARNPDKHFRKTGERLAEWIRSDEVGVTDDNVAPNHGWRHRFSSLAPHVDMHVDVQNIIQGHVGERTQ